MAKEKPLSSFKISDAVKRPVTPQGAAQASAKKKEAAQDAKDAAPKSAGFPNIERVIEMPTLDKAGLADRAQLLEELARSGDIKMKPAAKKALAAYKHASDLLDYLWTTKEALQGVRPPDPAPASAPKAAPKATKKSKSS